MCPKGDELLAECDKQPIYLIRRSENLNLETLNHTAIFLPPVVGWLQPL
jgi:hypothetical protein